MRKILITFLECIACILIGTSAIVFIFPNVYAIAYAVVAIVAAVIIFNIVNYLEYESGF